MPTFYIEARYANGQIAGTANVTADDPISAILHVARCYTWARGYTDYAAGLIWPFNPEMRVRVNGQLRRAADLAAEHYAAAAAGLRKEAA